MLLFQGVKEIGNDHRPKAVYTVKYRNQLGRDNVSLIIFVLGGCEACGSSLDAIIYTEEDTNEDPLLDFLDLSLMKDK